VPNGSPSLFTAIGTYRDGTILDLTSRVEWTSSNPTARPSKTTSESDGVTRTVSVGTTCHHRHANRDPLFVDEAALNMNLRPDSPALAIPGFKPIPFNRIGVRP
jgi:hypothetical protein